MSKMVPCPLAQNSFQVFAQLLFSLHVWHVPDNNMQATSLLTPVMAALAGEKPSR